MTETAGAPGATVRSEAMSALLARNWWAVLLRGIAAILFGLLALFMPGVTLASLVLVFAAYMLVDGIFAIVSAIRAARNHERWGLFVVEGILDLLAGAAAFLLPGAALLTFVALASIWALISGGLMFASAFRLRREHGRTWLFVSGAASVIWGALLLAFPAAGLVVLTWWLGAYAFVFGVSVIILSARLHQVYVHRTPSAAEPA